MLVELAVRNLGVIEDVRLTLGSGLTTVSGETGAGKTMVVDAIALLMGGRADPTLVRRGQDEATVEGLFAVDESEWVLRRVVPVRGRSRSYINGELATAAALGELGRSLIEVHGQHDQQSLLVPRHQRAALDQFAGIDRTALTDARRAVARLRQALEESGGDERGRAREIDLLRYQLDEIDEIEPVVGEDDELDRLETTLGSALEHRDAATRALALLTDDAAAGDQLARAIARIDGRVPFEEIARRLRDVAAELSDCCTELRSVGDSIEPDEERLAAIRGRRQKLVELRRKYGDTVEQVLEFRASAADRLEELTSHDATRVALQAELAAAEGELTVQCDSIGAARRNAAPELAVAVASNLGALALAGAQVEVDVADTAELPGAGESVELLLAVNQGANLGGLAKVASGGELSRVMLALRMVLSDGPPTMLFDEVDAGIGGETAISIGRALSDLAGDRQILVVTHLAQVAAFADHQVVVTKHQRAESTVTTAVRLDEAGRVVELARMLSGRPDSASAQEHAAELLRSARDSERSSLDASLR